MASGSEAQRESLDRIQAAIEEAARANPEEITSDDVRRILEGKEFHTEMMGGAFNRLKQQGMLESLGRKTSTFPGLKNRQITIYRATAAFRERLGLIPAGAAATTSKVSEAIEAIHAHAQGRNFVCDRKDVANFFLCLRSKPFVILSGISGTGKTRLPRIFAEAIGAKVRLIAVKPNWTDNSDLMGYYSVTHNDFIEGPLTEAIREAVANHRQAYFVVLDEMNLAHVEYYLSDLLSVMETRRRTDKKEVVTEPIPLDIPLGVALSDARQAKRWSELRALILPWNLFLVGTVNVDETTHPFSRKVLDRANTIEFSDVDIGSFGTAQSGVVPPKLPVVTDHNLVLERPLEIGDVYPKDAPFFDSIATKLDEVNTFLKEADMHFGYRTRDEVCLYMWAWRTSEIASILNEDEAFDLCLMQKVLPRCQGSSDNARRVIQRLFYWTVRETPDDAPVNPEDLDRKYPEASRPYRKSSQKLLRMLRRYRDTGFFSYWAS